MHGGLAVCELCIFAKIGVAAMMVNDHNIPDAVQQVRGGRQVGDMGVHHEQHRPFGGNVYQAAGRDEKLAVALLCL